MPFSIRPFRRLPLAYFSGFWLVITLLVLSSAPAYAEWVKGAYTESEGGYTVYVDPDTIRRKGDLVQMWVQYDYKTVQTVAGFSYLSEKTQQQYDCAEERYRFLSRTWFSGYMGTGNVVFDNSNESKWEPVAPESVGLTVWKVACGK
jgi:hypothetical protein